MTMNAAAKRETQWYDDPPPAGRTREALARVFELARCIPGSCDVDEQHFWQDWLDRVENAWLGTALPSCESPPAVEESSAPEKSQPIVPYPQLLSYVGTSRERRPKRCSFCRLTGHVKTTCGLNPKNQIIPVVTKP
jgi:hypothetical protein